VLQARPAAVSFEGANPRHEHEWTVFEAVKLPDGKCIIPGVIDSTTNFIEHPELVAQRIARYADIVGRENVVAGVDCGFATFVVRPPCCQRLPGRSSVPSLRAHAAPARSCGHAPHERQAPAR
jgi:methionine synthase II (cobalamin-independent)